VTAQQQTLLENGIAGWRDRDATTIAVAAKVLGISLNSAYNAAHSGQLPGAWLGARFLVSVAGLKKLVDRE
jgi:hypothetical protein